MPAAGDLKTVLSLEDFEYISGLRDAAAETEKFAGAVTQMGAKASAAAGTLKDAFRDGLQDFAKQGDLADVGKGALQTLNKTVTGAIQTMGPWGFAIGTVAGVLGDQLIPKLFEGKSAIDQLSDSLESSVSGFERLQGVWKSDETFNRHLDRAAKESSPDAIESEKRGLEDEASDLKASILRRQTKLRELVEKVLKDKPEGIGFNRQKGLFGNQDLMVQDIEVYDDIIGQRSAKAITDQQDKLNDERDRLDRARERSGKLGDLLPDARRRQRQREAEKQDAEQDKRQFEEIDRLREQTLTPEEKLQKRLSELDSLNSRMPDNEDLIRRGIDQAYEDFEHAQGAPDSGGPARLGGAMEQGSAAAFSTINRAMAQSQGGKNVPNEQLAEAKRQVEVAKDQLKQLEKMNDREKVVAVQLAGG